MLYAKSVSTYAELIEIKSVPASGSEPEMLEKTTLKDAVKTYMLGRQDSPAQTFTYNYNETDYETVEEFCDNTEHEFVVKFPDGTGTYIKGYASTYRNEVSANSVIEATLTISPSAIEFKNRSEVTALVGTGGSV